MATWPNIETPNLPLEEVGRLSTVRSPYEAGYVNTRPRWTRARRSFVLTWNALSSSGFSTLRAFFEETVRGGGDSFTWTHPVTSTSYTVRFAQDELRFTAILGDRYRGSVTLEEV